METAPNIYHIYIHTLPVSYISFVASLLQLHQSRQYQENDPNNGCRATCLIKPTLAPQQVDLPCYVADKGVKWNLPENLPDAN